MKFYSRKKNWQF